MIDRYKLGRILLTLAVVATPGFHVTADWSIGHVHDPSWPPHAKYHLIVFHFVVIMFALAGVYALWGQTPVRVSAVNLAAFTVFAIWVPFYATVLFPGTSPSPRQNSRRAGRRSNTSSARPLWRLRSWAGLPPAARLKFPKSR